MGKNVKIDLPMKLPLTRKAIVGSDTFILEDQYPKRTILKVKCDGKVMDEVIKKADIEAYRRNIISQLMEEAFPKRGIS